LVFAAMFVMVWSPVSGLVLTTVKQFRCRVMKKAWRCYGD
jgi:hypothetical protein